MKDTDVLQSENVWEPPHSKATIQDAYFYVVSAASSMQRASTSLRDAAHQGRPYDLEQWARTVRSDVSAIMAQVERLEAA